MPVVRSSSYRHLFADRPKTEDMFQGFRISTSTGEQQYIKANSKYFAVAVQGGGGPVAIVDHSKPGRMDKDLPVIAGHKGHTNDFDFNPFNDQIIATGSEDTTIKIWTIPEDGLTQNMSTPTQDLHGHIRKVTLLRFHPTASNILASVGADPSVKVWDIEKGKELFSLDGVHTQPINDIVWDYTGTQYATSSKDKTLRLIDARANTVATECKEAHDGSKSVKLSFLGRQDRLMSVGFTRSSGREMKMWDPRQMDKALKTVKLDQGSGVVIPYFDEDINVLYLASKGESTVRYYEIQNDDVFELSQYRSSQSTKGIGFMPKRACKVMACESARAFKFTQGPSGDGIVEPLSFLVPRKAPEIFQADIYPPTFAGVPSHTADEWLAGSNAAPMVKSLDPKGDGSVQMQDLDMKEYVAPKTASELKAELEAAKARISTLEGKLKEANIALPA